MLPDLSPVHILIVVIVALVVVGPEDLPKLLRKIGKFMGKMRGMANEFRASFDEMARQSELDELRKEVEAMRAAAQASVPDLGLKDLSLDKVLNSDAESSYMSQWVASQEAAEAYSSPDGIMTPLPKATEAAPAKVAKPRAKAAKPAEPAAEAAPAKKAAAPAKSRAKKPPAEAGS
jgi:sec-independent protein translocase protein TatB